MDTKCPYCGEELTKGYIKSSRDPARWLNESPNFIQKYTLFGGEVLSTSTLQPAYRCYNCDTIIIKLKEVDINGTEDLYQWKDRS